MVWCGVVGVDVLRAFVDGVLVEATIEVWIEPGNRVEVQSVIPESRLALVVCTADGSYGYLTCRRGRGGCRNGCVVDTKCHMNMVVVTWRPLIFGRKVSAQQGRRRTTTTGTGSKVVNRSHTTTISHTHTQSTTHHIHESCSVTWPRLYPIQPVWQRHHRSDVSHQTFESRSAFLARATYSLTTLLSTTISR